MSDLNPSEQQEIDLNERLSKRQLMKLQKAIKMLQSQENQQINHPKRRAHSNLNAVESTHRKKIKIDANPAPARHDQIISSPLNSSEPLSTTPQHHTQVPAQLRTHLNPHYTLPEEEAAIFNYLLCYSYTEGEKRLQKEGQDWTQIDHLEQEGLNISENGASASLCQKLSLQLKEVKDRIKQPLGKAHREFNQKFLKKQYLTQ